MTPTIPPTVQVLGVWFVGLIVLVGGVEVPRYLNETAAGINESVGAGIDGYQLVVARDNGWEFDRTTDDENSAEGDR